MDIEDEQSETNKEKDEEKDEGENEEDDSQSAATKTSVSTTATGTTDITGISGITGITEIEKAATEKSNPSQDIPTIITPTKDDEKVDNNDNDSVMMGWTNTTGIGLEGIDNDPDKLEEIAAKKNLNEILKDGNKQEKWMICLYKKHHRCVAPKAIPVP
eukprot:391785-Ditylum_brightwellii.AAC.1